MSTGRKQAKRISPEKTSENGVIPILDPTTRTTTTNPTTATTKSSLKFNSDLAKKVLLGLPNPDPSLLSAMRSDSKMSKEEIDALVKKVWDRRQIEIEKAAEDMVVPADTIAALLRDLDDYGKKFDVENILSNLNELEWLLGDLDNAQDFRKMGGVVPIIRLLNMTHLPYIQAKAAWVLGTASKYILASQNEATELGAMSLLLDMIDSSSCSEDDNDIQKQGKALYALGALLRHNPSTQIVFRGLQGSSTLARAMQRCIQQDTTTRGTLKVLRKVTSLIGDLLRGGSREDKNLHGVDVNDWTHLFVNALMSTSSRGQDIISLRGDVIETHEKIFEAVHGLVESVSSRSSRSSSTVALTKTLAKLLTETPKLYEAWGDDFVDRSEFARDAISAILRELSIYHEDL